MAGQTLTLTFDSTPPELALSLAASTPFGHALTETVYYGAGSGAFTVTVRAADPLAGLDRLDFPGATTPGHGYALAGQSAVTQAHVYTFDLADSFSATVQLEAADRAGNVSLQPLHVVNDETPPQVLFALPPLAGLALPVTWHGFDDAAGIRHYAVQYKREGEVEWTEWLTTTAEQAIFVGEKETGYYFQVRATDNVNNESAWVEAGPVEVSGVTKYYTFNGRRVALRQGDVVYYLSGDHLGSTSLTTDDTGAVVSEGRYLPYGQERWTDGAAVTDFGFTSQRREGFGLYDYNARYYSPYLNRFISADTVVPDFANPQSLNRYSYVLGNPLNYVDPTGHQEEPDWLDGLKYLDETFEEPMKRMLQETYEGIAVARSKAEQAVDITADITFEIIQGTAQTLASTEIAEAAMVVANNPQPDIVIAGINAGCLAPVIGQGPTIGAEGIVNTKTGELGVFSYNGVMEGHGVGGTLNPYVGVAWNVPDNQSYTKDFESLTGTYAPFGSGLTATVFWAPSFSSDKSFGVAVGAAAGPEVSLTHSSTFYHQLLPV
ncbi:MAG: hypothetical protein JW953_13415, partial [Anaerolineae bacterium]|nr:hypothetical protein [Anaerolineae bacterium]